jgi:hypothetical protein
MWEALLNGTQVSLKLVSTQSRLVTVCHERLIQGLRRVECFSFRGQITNHDPVECFSSFAEPDIHHIEAAS